MKERALAGGWGACLDYETATPTLEAVVPELRRRRRAPQGFDA